MAVMSLRHIKSRIKGVESTRKLTRAMEMVSSSKLKRTQKMREAAQRYFSSARSMLAALATCGEDISHPLFSPAPSGRRKALLVVTSDAGLCGSYTVSVVRAAEQWLAAHTAEETELIVVGKRGFASLKSRGYRVARSFLGLNGRYTSAVGQSLSRALEELLTQGQTGEVHAVYARSESGARVSVVCERILPLECAPGAAQEHIPESSLSEILEGLLPLYLESRIRMLLLEAFCAEHQSRAMAMGEATKNAVELLEKLILTRNKIRQANITREIIEIVSSAEALKG